MFCVFVAVVGGAQTEQGRQVETSLLPSRSISVQIHLYNKETCHADATQDFTTLPSILSRHKRGKISLAHATSVQLERHHSISVCDVGWGVSSLMDE